MWRLTVLSFILVFINAHYSGALDNGLARTPPMGWLAWERFRCNVDCKNDPKYCISERLFMEMAEKMVSDGYLAAGYEYVILDDCWMAKKRDEKGRLIPDPDRFPPGIKHLADFIHAKGLKFGIYEDIGTETCGGYPGIQGYEEQDMQTFADWGVDYLKLDGCYRDAKDFDTAYPMVERYLNETGRPIVYSCSWPAYLTGDPNVTVPWEKIKESCNLWRNYDDIQDSYDSVVNIVKWFAANQDELIPVAGPGHWNDPDMLLTGNFGLSEDQAKGQMAIWAMLAAPLIMSNDLRKIHPASKRILLNKDVIEVNQDKLGIQGRQILSSDKNNGVEVWTRPLEPTARRGNYSAYSYAVALWNKRDDGMPVSISKPLSFYGLTDPEGYFVKNLYSKRDHGLMMPSDVLPVKVDPTGGVYMFKATLADAQTTFSKTQKKKSISPKKYHKP